MVVSSHVNVSFQRAALTTALRAAHLIVWSPSSVVTDLEKHPTALISACLCPWMVAKEGKSQRCAFGQPSRRLLCDMLFSNQMANSDVLSSNRWPSCRTMNVTVGQHCRRLRINVAEIKQTDHPPDDLHTVMWIDWNVCRNIDRSVSVKYTGCLTWFCSVLMGWNSECPVDAALTQTHYTKQSCSPLVPPQMTAFLSKWALASV